MRHLVIKTLNGSADAPELTYAVDRETPVDFLLSKVYQGERVLLVLAKMPDGSLRMPSGAATFKVVDDFDDITLQESENAGLRQMLELARTRIIALQGGEGEITQKIDDALRYRNVLSEDVQQEFRQAKRELKSIRGNLAGLGLYKKGDVIFPIVGLMMKISDQAYNYIIEKRDAFGASLIADLKEFQKHRGRK